MNGKILQPAFKHLFRANFTDPAMDSAFTPMVIKISTDFKKKIVHIIMEAAPADTEFCQELNKLLVQQHRGALSPPYREFAIDYLSGYSQASQAHGQLSFSNVKINDIILEDHDCASSETIKVHLMLSYQDALFYSPQMMGDAR